MIVTIYIIFYFLLAFTMVKIFDFFVARYEKKNLNKYNGYKIIVLFNGLITIKLKRK